MDAPVSTTTMSGELKWRSALLKDVADIGAGNSAPQKKEFFEGGRHPFIRTSDVGQIRFGAIDGARDFLNDKGISGLRLVPEGTVLMPKSGASTFLNHRVVMAADGYVSSHLATITARKSISEPRYLLYYLSTVEAQDLIQDHNYPSLTLAIIGEIRVPLPPLEEQKRIVAVLDQAFAALDHARAHAEASLADAGELLENSLNAIFQKLATTSHVVKLEDAVHRECKLSYGIVQPGDDVEGGLPVVRPVDLKRRVITLSGLKLISPDRASGYGRTKLAGGELLLSVRGSTGELSIAAPELAGANVTRGIVPIRFMAEKILPEFAYFQMHSRYVRDQIAARTYGAALMQINIKDVRQIRFIAPTIPQQRAIAEYAEGLDARSRMLQSSYERKLGDIVALRQSLLQKAFAGELT